jgi:hypothetical protein
MKIQAISSYNHTFSNKNQKQSFQTINFNGVSFAEDGIIKEEIRLFSQEQVQHLLSLRDKSFNLKQILDYDKLPKKDRFIVDRIFNRLGESRTNDLNIELDLIHNIGILPSYYSRTGYSKYTDLGYKLSNDKLGEIAKIKYTANENKLNDVCKDEKILTNNENLYTLVMPTYEALIRNIQEYFHDTAIPNERTDYNTSLLFNQK